MAIDWKNLSDEQILVADKIIAEAKRQNVDPQLALSIGYIESNFNPNPPRAKDPKTGKVTSAVGPMQLTIGAAKDTDVEDRHDVDENIRGGVTYIKQGLDKYKDPYIAALRYKEGDDVVQSYLKTKDASVIPDTGIQYWDSLSQHYQPSEEKKEAVSIRPPVDLPAVEGAPAPSMMGDLARGAWEAVSQNPEATLSFGVAPLAGYAQWKLNKELADRIKAGATKETPGAAYARKVLPTGTVAGESMLDSVKNYKTQQLLGPGETLSETGRVALPVGVKEKLEAEELAKSKQIVPRVRGALEKTGKWLSKFPLANVGAGFGAGMQAEALRERLREGDVPGSIVSGLGTTFNTLAMLPAVANPYLLGAKGLGTIGSVGMIPVEIAYEKYRQAHPLKRKQAEVEVGQPTIKVNP